MLAKDGQLNGSIYGGARPSVAVSLPTDGERGASLLATKHLHTLIAPHCRVQLYGCMDIGHLGHTPPFRFAVICCGFVAHFVQRIFKSGANNRTPCSLAPKKELIIILIYGTLFYVIVYEKRSVVPFFGPNTYSSITQED